MRLEGSVRTAVRTLTVFLGWLVLIIAGVTAIGFFSLLGVVRWLKEK